MRERNFYEQQIWMGAFQGLYGANGQVERPTNECWGPWILEKRQEIADFRYQLFNDAWQVSMDDSRKVAYDIVDLIFLNDEYCHFRSTFWDLHTYFNNDESMSFSEMMENAQKNAFGIITQVSSAASIFKQDKWEDMTMEGRGYALNQLGHSMASLFQELSGFSYMKIADIEPY